MADSFENINYSVRAAKSIERKMLCDALRRLVAFSPLDKYRYIGFGSTYFTDFQLIHRSLGIKTLISVEKAVEKKPRFLFNRPFRCIRVMMGHSNSVLPCLTWKTRTILWLDYDGKLSDEVISDIETFCQRAPSGSVLIVTFNAQPEEDGGRLTLLKESITKVPLPGGIKESDLGLTGLPKVYYEVFSDAVNQCLSDRNGMEQDDKKQFKFSQIFNFLYADGSQMMTVGGIVYTKRDEKKFKKCEFNKLDFVVEQEEPLKIQVPSLTFREIHALEKNMPSKKPEKSKVPVPPRDKTKYSKVYRYFPTFAETDF